MVKQVLVGAYTDKRGRVRPITKSVGRMKGARRARKYKARNARYYGDNPNIRVSHGEKARGRKGVNLREEWEVRHAIKTGKLKEVK